MFGKHFASLYEGSMVGAGAVKFAVFGYCIARQVPDRVHGTLVELNPKLLAFMLGEKEKDIMEALAYLCAPDPNSRSKEEGGRRLIKVGEFSYQLVNGAKYRNIRDSENRRQQNCDAQARFREKKRTKGKPLPGEANYVRQVENGAPDEVLDELTAPKE